MPLHDTIYITGSVEKIPTNFVLDTGAMKTVVSTKIYKRIPSVERPVITKKGTLVHAGGEQLNVLGKCNMSMKLGTFQIEHEVTIADINDDVLLGMDILNGKKGKPADIILSQNKIVLDGVEIKCRRNVTNQIRHVKAADHFIIQGETEQIIDVFIDRTEDDDLLTNTTVLIEPSDNFKEKFPLVMAASLADINGAPTAKVRVMNPFKYDVSIKQDTKIGVAELVTETPITLFENIDQSETTNFQSARRLQFTNNKDDMINRTNNVSEKNVTQTNIDRSKVKIPEHLRELYENSIEGKTQEQQDKLADLLVSYQDVFSKGDNDLGRTNVGEHVIDTGDAYPIKQPFRRVPMAYAEEEKKAIDKMLDQGVIRPSKSPWASPLLLTKKKDGSFRPCIDYRKVNKVTKVDAFPIPKVDECIDAVSGSTCFSTLDLISGYHQVPVREQDIPKTAFSSKYGHNEFVVSPFGMTNSGATFQRVIELVLTKLQWEICIIYIDDIIVYAKSFDQNIDRLKLIFQRFREANLKLKPKKCELAKAEVTFLGYRVNAEEIRPEPTNVAKVLQWPVPQNVKEVRQFLGLAGYYRKSVHNFSTIAKPLNDLTKNESELIWTAKCQEAFDRLKQALTSPDVMSLPMDKGDFILDVDASNYGIGAVLSQIQDGKEKVVSYASRTMCNAEQNYCVTERELLAIVNFVQYFRHYLLGREFTIRSDHMALKYLFSFKAPKNRIARWLEILSNYNFSIEYRKGSKHSNCDALSRCPNPKDCDCTDVDNESFLCGPCKKCIKKAEQMESSLVYKEIQNKLLSQSNVVKRTMIHCKSSMSHFTNLFVNGLQQSVVLMFMLLVTFLVTMWDTGCSVATELNRSTLLAYGKAKALLGSFRKKDMVLKLNRSTWFSCGKIKALLGSVRKKYLLFKLKWSTCIAFGQAMALWASVRKKYLLLKLKWSTCFAFGQAMALWASVRKKYVLILSESCRSVTTRSESKFLDDYVPWINGHSVHDIREMQRSDPDIGHIVSWKLEGKPPSVKEASVFSPVVRHYVIEWDSMVLNNGILFRNYRKVDGTGNYLQLVVPKVLQNDVMYHMHNSVMSGHLGQKKT